MKRIALAAVLVLAAFGVQGCAAGGPAGVQSVPTPAATATAEPIVPAVQTAGRTVLLLDAAQVGTLTGTTLTVNTVDQAMVELVKPKTWAAHAVTKKYAELIARAFVQQGGIAYGAVNATARDTNARLKVIIIHTPQHLSVDVQRGAIGD